MALERKMAVAPMSVYSFHRERAIRATPLQGHWGNGPIFLRAIGETILAPSGPLGQQLFSFPLQGHWGNTFIVTINWPILFTSFFLFIWWRPCHQHDHPLQGHWANKLFLLRAFGATIISSSGPLGQQLSPPQGHWGNFYFSPYQRRKNCCPNGPGKEMTVAPMALRRKWLLPQWPWGGNDCCPNGPEQEKLVAPMTVKGMIMLMIGPSDKQLPKVIVFWGKYFFHYEIDSYSGSLHNLQAYRVGQRNCKSTLTQNC